MLVNFHFMLIYSPACSTCLFSWYGLLITVGGVGGVGGDFSQTTGLPGKPQNTRKHTQNAQHGENEY